MSELTQAEKSQLIAKRIQNLSREPFKEFLTKILGCEPSVEAMQAWAETHPDRYGHLLKTVSNLSGYESGEGGTVTNNFLINIESKSDAELQARLDELRGTVVEGEVVSES